MTSTLTPTCSFCGLRFDNRPLLELHLREDHPQHGSPAPSRADHPADSPAPPATLAPRDGQRASTPRAGEEITGTGSERARRPRAGWATARLRGLIGAVRRGNAQFLLAAEVTLRPAGAPRPGRPGAPPAKQDVHHAATVPRADRAA